MPEKYREYIHGDKAEIPYGETVIEEYAFLGCKDLTALEIPDSVKTIGRRAFYCCTGLISVEIPNSVTEIGGNAFAYCTGLTSVEIPDSVTTIGKGAFQGYNIERLVVHSQNPRYSCSGNCVLSKNREILVLGCKASIIPNSVKTISGFAFASCTGLTSVEIPDSVKTIGGNAFFGCTGLTIIKFHNSKPSESQILLEALGIEDYGQISLYTPIGAGYAYRHNDFFKQFKEIIPTLR